MLRLKGIGDRELRTRKYRRDLSTIELRKRSEGEVFRETRGRLGDAAEKVAKSRVVGSNTPRYV